jgi:hypothetical protein
VKVLPDHDPGRVIHVQDVNRHFAHTRLANQEGTPPSEMTTPDLPPRVEEADDFSMEQSRQVRALGSIAFPAGETKVVRTIAAAVLPGNDVLDVKGVVIEVVLVNLAVLATVPGAPPHQCLDAGSDHQPPDDWVSS